MLRASPDEDSGERLKPATGRASPDGNQGDRLKPATGRGYPPMTSDVTPESASAACAAARRAIGTRYGEQLT